MLLGYSSDIPIPVFTSKFAFDSSNYIFDFSPALASGDTIATLGSISATPSGSLEIGSGSVVSGLGGPSLGIQARISSGAPGQLYTITVQVLTTGGDQFSRAAMLQVQ